MSLSSSTLVAIQKAGAAVFTADEKLKQAAKNYADRVNAAMASNPDSLGNDALIENWKTVARLSQTLAGIEAEIKKVYQIASELTGEDQPSVVAAPKRAAKPVVVAPTGKIKTTKQAKSTTRVAAVVPMPAVIDLTPTDVVIKSKKKAAKSQASVAATPKSVKVKKTRISAPVAAAPAKVATKPKTKTAAPKTKATSVKRAKVKAQPGEVSGNAAKLLSQLERVLNTNDFTEINQTELAKEATIALGSMTAALKKLMELGRITAGPTGSYKLVAPAAAVVTPEVVAS
jgi:hypothetical protein